MTSTDWRILVRDYGTKDISLKNLELFEQRLIDILKLYGFGGADDEFVLNSCTSEPEWDSDIETDYGYYNVGFDGTYKDGCSGGYKSIPIQHVWMTDEEIMEELTAAKEEEEARYVNDHEQYVSEAPMTRHEQWDEIADKLLQICIENGISSEKADREINDFGDNLDEFILDNK